MRTYVAGCSFTKTCLWNSIYQNKWFNNSMFDSMFDKLKEVKHFNKITNLKKINSLKK